MIFKRAVARLRAQDWIAICIELAIVIVGVFIGTWVANWNQQRQAAAQTRQTLKQLEPELRQLETYSQRARDYYAITDRYADVALAGWHDDPKVSDADFVIAAYQASQVFGFNNNGASWSLVFGASDLRNIPDLQVRQGLTRLMTFDYTTLNLSAVKTPYRDSVREVIPDSIQQRIRSECGDVVGNDGGSVTLHSTCSITIDPALAAKTAAGLRADQSLERQLGQHRSVIAAFLLNLDLFDRQDRALSRRIGLIES
jgi:hypothetical protein